MRLTELEPRWIHDNVFVFRCPHCRQTWLSCKSVAMPVREQFALFNAAGVETESPRYGVVPMNQGHAWEFSGRDFDTLTVKPSIDASASGHWHGFIKNGEIA